MIIKRPAIAGTLESNDVLVRVTPFENGIELDIDSIVKKQFGDKIKEVVYETLKKFNISNISIKIQDKGALDCVLEARIETALFRGAEEV